MCMGFGCNAVGVTGCRIIDSKRERLIAILTNAFVPCNGRFPTLIALIAMFFVVGGGLAGSFVSAAILAGLVVLCVVVTLVVSRILSGTVCKGEPSSFLLELPPYRRPQIGKVIVRSILDRTLFVLGRAVAVAAPAGLILWLLGNITIDGIPLLVNISVALNGIGHFFGMDGVILLAFILALPANEIIVPIVLMIYSSGGVLTAYTSLGELQGILVANGWTTVTAICVTVFLLFHWPCSTTLWTIGKETKKVRYVLLSAVLPTAVGLILCALIHAVSLLI